MTCSPRHQRPECPDVRSISAVSILRVSTKRQLAGEGIASQRKGNSDYMKEKGYKLFHEFELAESADGGKERLDFTQALAFCERHKKDIGVVVIWKVDRFTRGGLATFYAIKAHLTRLGIRLESATEQIDDTPSGEAMEGFLAIFARMDNRIRSERTIGAEIKMTQEGYWCRPAPTGFINAHVQTGTTSDGKAIFRPTLKPIQDEKQWELLSYGLRKQMTGIYKITEVAKELAAKGFMSREGNSLTPQTWTKICRSPVYGGLMREQWTDFKLIPAKFTGAISADEWHELQRVLDGGKKVVKLPRQSMNPAFPLRRFILCPSCGLPARGYASEGKGGNKYAYYDCERKECNFRVSAHDAHAAFEKFLEKLHPTKELLNLFRAVLLRDWNERYKELNRESIELQQRELDLRKEKKNLVKLMTDNVQSPAVVNALTERLQELEKELTVATVFSTEKKVEAYDSETIINYCVHYMENVSELWHQAPVEKKFCFQSLIFPDKLPYDVLLDKRTPKLSPLYALIRELQTSESELAAPRGIEPRLQE